MIKCHTLFHTSRRNKPALGRDHPNYNLCMIYLVETLFGYFRVWRLNKLARAIGHFTQMIIIMLYNNQIGFNVTLTIITSGWFFKHFTKGDNWYVI